MQIRAFHAADESAVVALWDACRLTRPWNDPHKDIARKLAVQPELFLVGVVDQAVVASVMAGYEGHRGWMNYLAVAPHCRGRGYGRALVEHVERLLLERGSPKINLQVRASNPAAVAFYRRLGYAQDESISLGKRLIVDA
jgi:ribosomal protein S18 acetylase RimI-like enzyme